MNETPEGTREPQRTIVGNFEITLNLTQTRGIKMLGYVYSDDNPKQLNERVDFYQDVLDRQAIRVDIVSKEAQIAMHRINLETIGEAYEELVAVQKKGKKLSSQQQQQLNNFDPSVRQAKKMIESLQAAIDEGKRKLAAT